MILVIDDSGVLFELIEETIGGLGVPISRVKDIPSAKRKLLEFSPKLVVAFTQVGKDEQAGFRFCKELKSHPSLSEVPVLLFTNELTDVALQAATESGAKGLAPWPVSGESLRRRVGMLLPEINSKEVPGGATAYPSAAPAAPQKPVAPAQPVAPAAPVAAPKSAPAAVAPAQPKPVPAPKVEQPLSDFDKKLQIAQQILAKVLYDLKTSHLLQVVDFEDVPRVVGELTRSVCAAGTADKEKRPPMMSAVGLSIEGGPAATPHPSTTPPAAATPAAAEESSSGVTGMDLDRIFGKKKL